MKKLQSAAVALGLLLITTVAFAQVQIFNGPGGAIKPNAPASNRNVGIGTNNPSAALHLVTGSNTGMLPPVIKLDRNDGTNQSGVLAIGISGSSFNPPIPSGSAGFTLSNTHLNAPNADIGFAANGPNVPVQLIIKHNGNIGINTSTPLHKLQVHNGAIMISGNVAGFGGPQLLFSDNLITNPNGRWAIEYLAAAPSRPGLSGMNFWQPFPGGGGAGNYSLFLKDDGKIGMGVNNDNTDPNFCASAFPGGYRLYVKGGILTDKVKVAVYCSLQWADYVFDEGYKLRPLDEVAAFAKANKHLPGVPSAKQLVKDGGIDMTQMFAKQMEKIEELTLYIIEMKTEIDLLKKK